jgi:hypothetical protein
LENDRPKVHSTEGGRLFILLVMSGTTFPPALASQDRAEATIETGLTYDGLTPVQVRVTKRDGRYKISDAGAAVAAADANRARFPESISFGKYSVNVSRQGVVWLPAVAPRDEWLATVCDLVARGSVALYERLLEIDASD